MTATNAPTSPTELSAEQKAHEPSMDDILASIRRLISDDDALPLSRRARASARTRAPSTDAPPEPDGEATEPPAPPRDPFLGLVHRLGRRSSAVAAEAAISASNGANAGPNEPEAKPEPSVSPPPASVIAKTPALKLRDFALKNFVTRADADPVEREPAATVESAVASAAPEFLPAPIRVDNLRPSLPASDEPAPQIASVVSLPTRPAPTVEARTKISPLPLRPPVFAPPPAETIVEAARERLPESPEEAALLSAASDARIGASLEALAESLFARDKDILERTARELLRPMLKDWLDDNLPGLVERLVRAEIERIARGRG